MNNQEAIEELERLNNGTDYDTEYTDFECFEMAIEALGKQIPKKPISFECIHPDWIMCDIYNVDCENLSDCRYGEHLCPSCKESLHYDNLDSPPYCPDCGQKLDWSGEEEYE